MYICSIMYLSTMYALIVGTACPFIAATSTGTCMILSSWATRSIEEVPQASGYGGLRWFHVKTK